MPLSVITTGLSRTGTWSLKLALETLGFGPCHHMSEYIPNYDAYPLWERASAGEAVDWDEVFRGYRSCTDSPGSIFYRELADFYPDAKVILNTRDPDQWYDSLRASLFPEGVVERLNGLPDTAFYQRTYRQIYAGRVEDRAKMTAFFREREDEVRRTIPAERLLVFDLSEGWAPLCRFLGVAVPHQPFPRVNSRDEFHADGSRAQQAMSKHVVRL